MLRRKTYHECARELLHISERFRTAYLDDNPDALELRRSWMESASVEGIKTLRSLALSVRNDQDYGHTTNPRDAVGALINDATNEQAKEILDRYRPPYWNVPGQQPLLLRDGLNKVAHPDPSGYGFFADEHSHDLILSGRLRGKNWIAILSLLDLSKVLMKIPDKELDKSDEEWID